MTLVHSLWLPSLQSLIFTSRSGTQCWLTSSDANCWLCRSKVALTAYDDGAPTSYCTGRKRCPHGKMKTQR
ncbi:hypothetical protein KP509_07G045500 [Ceratopteris richardii]|uniref:Secreted protein n=1 Tax=Ceratopteris richardii TaxID=49495 RepID=A0A8T2UEJ1_CERRI|nr:hypothetical protein KP509_07G045500 [Ceratopteris richardii]